MKGVPQLPKPRGDTITLAMLVYEYRRCQRRAMKAGEETVTFEQFIDWLEGEGYF